MATFPCPKCGSVGPAQVREALVNANPAAPLCPACQTPVDETGKSLEQNLGPQWVDARQ